MIKLENWTEVTNCDGIHMIYISCEHRELCNRLRKHIEKGMNKND